ncbi:mitochondrial import inner membrane translocase subunit Tim21-like [Ornithodoros turicata]|uniref:Mitochondrial import inner membrane translocase subunit Tim21 n=1 Tax=Ornithodoros turicata TaxID=34597 RepID=A0A2R5LHX0_9ACAR
MIFSSKVQVLVTGCKAKGLRTWAVQSMRPTLVPHLDRIYFKTLEPRPALGLRQASTAPNKASNAITEARENESAQLTIGQKVKQTTKDASYLGVILAGLSVTGLMFYAIFRELFSGRSPNSVYTRALERCRSNTSVLAAFGEPLQGHGETTARGRRRHVSHVEYIKDGINHMRMKFYIKGPHKSGTVHLEVRENAHKQYEYRYLFVDVDGPTRRTIVLEDNRDSDHGSVSDVTMMDAA